jgi:hypothetical protein
MMQVDFSISKSLFYYIHSNLKKLPDFYCIVVLRTLQKIATMANLLMIDGCRSDKMFDDTPDNQPVHYTKCGLSNDVGLDL